MLIYKSSGDGRKGIFDFNPTNHRERAPCTCRSPPAPGLKVTPTWHTVTVASWTGAGDSDEEAVFILALSPSSG